MELKTLNNLPGTISWACRRKGFSKIKISSSYSEKVAQNLTCESYQTFMKIHMHFAGNMISYSWDSLVIFIKLSTISKY